MENQDDGMRLVPKPGKTMEFLVAFNEMVKIANGNLGWQGQAEMMYAVGMQEMPDIKPLIKGTTQEEITKELVGILQEVYLSKVYEFGEWLPKEEAEKRVAAERVLYGPQPQE